MKPEVNAFSIVQKCYTFWVAKKTRAVLDREIKEVKKKIQKLGPLLPGSLSPQERPGNPPYQFWQLNCRAGKKTRTLYVSEELRPSVEGQINNYKEFKKLTDELKLLSLERASIQIRGK